MKSKPSYMYDSCTGEIIKMRWWHVFTNSKYRRARREYNKSKDNLIVVAKTSNGMDVAVPSHLVADWHALSALDRAEFLAAANEQANEAKVRGEM